MKNFLEKLKENFLNNKIYFICLALICLFGLYFRLASFVNAPDLYGDEASLAFNLFEKNIPGYFGKLDYAQACPPLFLLFTKFFTLFIPDFEYSLRIIPFLSSIAALFAFLILCFKFFKNKIAIVTAFLFFALCPKIIAHTCIFKQYSTDILIYILILLSYFYLDFNKKDKKFYAIIFSYAIAIWFSYTAIFAFAGVFLLKIIQSKKMQNLVYSAPFVFSFILFYIFENHLNSNVALHSYWNEGFINANFSNILNIFYANFKWFFVNSFNSAIFSLFFIPGFIFAIKNFKDEKNLLKLVLLFITIVLSYSRIYPFSLRVALYALPVLILILATFIEYVDFKKSGAKTFLVRILIFISGCSMVYFQTTGTIYSEEIETVLLQAKYSMEQNNGSKNILYIPQESRNIAKFYIEKRPKIYNFKEIYFENMPDKSEFSIEKYIDALEKISQQNFAKGDTIYYAFVHHTKKPDMLNALYLWAKEKQNFKIYTNNSNFDALIIFKR